MDQVNLGTLRRMSPMTLWQVDRVVRQVFPDKTEEKLSIEVTEEERVSSRLAYKFLCLNALYAHYDKVVPIRDGKELKFRAEEGSLQTLRGNEKVWSKLSKLNSDQLKRASRHSYSVSGESSGLEELFSVKLVMIAL